MKFLKKREKSSPIQPNHPDSITIVPNSPKESHPKKSILKQKTATASEEQQGNGKQAKLKDGSQWRSLQRRLSSATRVTARLGEHAGRYRKGAKDEEAQRVKRSRAVIELLSERQIEMEPLVCLQSCLALEACMALGYCEVLLLLLAFYATIQDLIKNDFWWLSEPSRFINTFTHLLTVLHLILILVAFAILYRGLTLYEHIYIRVYFVMQAVSINCSLLSCVLFLLGLTLDSHVTLFTVTEVVALMCNVLVEMWGMTALRQTIDYLQMCHVFIEMRN